MRYWDVSPVFLKLMDKYNFGGSFLNKEENIKSIVLWVTDDCNLRCKYCYARAGDNKNYMDIDTFIKVLDLVGENSFKLQIAGGEPLMNFILVEQIYDYIKENNLKTRIKMQTNGTLITNKIAEKIKKMNIAVGISLDGPPEVNDRLRGKTLQTLNGIKELGSQGVIVNINSVVTDESIKYLDKLVDIAFYCGNVYGIGLDILRKTGRYMDNSDEVKEATVQDIKKYLMKAYNRTKYLYELSGRKIVLRDIEEARIRLSMKNPCKEYCYAALGNSMVILPNGDIYPCASLVNKKEYFMGNVHDKESFKIKKLVVKTNEFCKGCEYEEFCPKGCPARLLINNGNNGFFPLDCALKKAAFDIVSE